MRAPTARWVWATFSFIGFHDWPDAPEHRSYLSDRHRHLFMVRAAVTTTHDDREVECHDLLDEARRGVPTSLEGMSVESIAGAVASQLRRAYGMRDIRVSVSEDGEVGADLEWVG